MNGNRNHLLIGGGIVLGAAACGLLAWWTISPLPPENSVVDDSPAALQQGANRFRVRAYHRATGTLLELPRPVAELSAEKGREGLEELPSVGHSIARSLRDILAYGNFVCSNVCAVNLIPSRGDWTTNSVR